MSDITDKDARIKTLEEDCVRLEKEKAARDSELAQFRLMNEALKAEPEKSKAIDDFKNIMDNDFMKFAGEETSCPNEAQIYTKLQQVYTDLRLIAGFPALYTKNVGAIGGGFSSGKSSFINSFIKDTEIKLPVGIKPVTAIPSYITSSEKSEIKGYSNKGANFKMTTETYKSLSHENLKNTVFDLKSVVPYITVSCPLDKDLLGNICLIDTPGYNAAAAGTSEADRRTAKEAIENANFLIWLVGLGANGTIGKSDFEFLKDLPFGKDSEHELYIVLNKAELLKVSDIESILDTACDCLYDNDFEYAGICAYSANTKKLFASRKIDIYEFLKRQNRLTENITQVDKGIDDVCDSYKKALVKDKYEMIDQEKALKSIKTQIKDMLFNAQNTQLADAIESALLALIERCNIDEFDKYLKAIENLRNQFKSCVTALCKELGIERKIVQVKYKKFCDACGTPLDIAKKPKFCPKCGRSAIIV